MAYDRPTLPALITRINADLLGSLGTGDALRRAEAPVYGRVISYAVHGLYGYQQWAAAQAIPSTSDTEALDRWASIWLAGGRKAATTSAGTLTLTTTAGAVITAGRRAVALDGVEYVVTGSVTATGSSTTVNIEAIEAGAAGNRDAGQVLTLVSPIAGVQAAGIASALVGGADAETDDDLSARITARIQSPPQGGAEDDYVAWALECDGITRAWVTTAPPYVYVRVMAGSAIPSGAQVAAVQSYIDAPSRRPVTARLVVLAPVAAPLNLVISDLVPDTASVRMAVAEAFEAFILAEAAPGATITHSRLVQALSSAAGETSHTLVSPAADVTHAVGEIATVGTITWS
ncbi:baseplate J/gp47 family protein [Derxia gummosa]|uniref:Baseplate J/gp47 family protein n=1 Tax=Derxia gummosa DSM 723 TaxID=1121388 RepID=A0A8B6X2T0_9BURK|nr:baseplate J/gp47 family protein [Derxia gummosa]